MNYSYGSRCAIALFVAALFSVLGSQSAFAQAGGGGEGGGDSIHFAFFNPTSFTGDVGGTIEILDPNGEVDAEFAFWETTELVNGTAQSVRFYQTVYMFDNNGSIVDSISHVLDVPGQQSAVWTVLKNVVKKDGMYSLDGELGYFGPQNNPVILDSATEDFSVMD